MEEEGTEDNGLEEDSRDGQVCGIPEETSKKSATWPAWSLAPCIPLYRRIWKQVWRACRILT